MRASSLEGAGRGCGQDVLGTSWQNIAWDFEVAAQLARVAKRMQENPAPNQFTYENAVNANAKINMGSEGKFSAEEEMKNGETGFEERRTREP